MELSDVTGWRILSTGGTLKEESCALVGPLAESMLAAYHVDKVIISCKGVDENGGFSDSNDSHAALKRRMLACGAQKIFAVDSSKFGKRSFIEISGFDGIDAVITDRIPPEPWGKLLSGRAANRRTLFRTFRPAKGLFRYPAQSKPISRQVAAERSPHQG